MSDFFGDDFTAELKGYFLDSLSKDLENFVDLIDASTWIRIRSEIAEVLPSWAVDARTNEFSFFADWMESLQNLLKQFNSDQEFKKSLKTFREYLNELVETKKDAENYLTKYSLSSAVQGENQFLHCRCNQQEFVIPIGNVVEVSSGLKVFPLPEKRQGLTGMVPFRGDAIPVLNLQEYGFQDFEGKRTYFVICEFKNSKLALQVSETDDIVTLKDQQLQIIEQGSSFTTAPFIKSFYVQDGRNIMVIDLEVMTAA
jgi:purine-binding chemotaxis protein CheW